MLIFFIIRDWLHPLSNEPPVALVANCPNYYKCAWNLFLRLHCYNLGHNSLARKPQINADSYCSICTPAWVVTTIILSLSL